MNKNSILVFFGVFALFVVLTVVYFKPMVFNSKVLSQHDIQQWKGGSKELYSFKEKNEDKAFPAWTNSMFSGMPSFLVSDIYDSNITHDFTYLHWLGITYPATIVLMALVSMFLFLSSFRLNITISILGAIAFAFASFNLISIMAGHNAKVVAIAYTPLVLAGFNWVMNNKKYLIGAAIISLGIVAELNSGHIQIVYYLFLIGSIFGIINVTKLIREKEFGHLGKSLGVILVAVIIGVGPNYSRLINVADYGKYSIRGKSELLSKEDNKGGSGLDRDYAFAWSQGRLENLTYLIPNLFGGASTSSLDKDSEAFKAFRKQGASKSQSLQQIQRMPTYWGDQSFTAGPVYLGAIICFLFILGLLVLEKNIRTWLIISTLLGVFLSMGKNFSSLNYFLFDYLPGLNKFRTPSMAVIICHLTFSTGAALALNKVLFDNSEIKDLTKKLLISFGITGGFSFLLFLMGGIFFDFEGGSDSYIGQQAPWLLDALIEDRKSMMQSDAFRSFVFIALAFGGVWYALKSKVDKQYVVIGIAVLVLIDLWSVDKRYLNEGNFERKSKQEVFQKTVADESILKDTDLHYRVFNVNNPFNEARTSYFHKSIGGYHGAKMRRYQDVINEHLSKNNTSVLAMLNTKYVITDINKPAQRFPNLGNAWFVENIELVNSPDEELAYLGTEGFDPAKIAVLDKSKFALTIETSPVNGAISLLEYKPNYLKYNSKSDKDGLAVFSEVYYPEGWEVKIDDKIVDHIRVDYILRGLEIPSGEHTIEFSFQPSSYVVGEKISLVSSYLFFAFVFGVFGFVAFQEYKKKK